MTLVISPHLDHAIVSGSSTQSYETGVSGANSIFDDASNRSQLVDERFQRMLLDLEGALKTELSNLSSTVDREHAITAQLRAAAFLAALPSHVGPPAIAIDPDLDVQMEWIVDRDHRVVVALDHRGVLSFSALFGRSNWFGTEDFSGQVPQVVWHALQRVLRSRPEQHRI